MPTISSLKIPKKPSKKFIANLLEEHYHLFNTSYSISESLPDPLGIARDFRDDKVALFCALFSYGNVKAIINFLQSCNLHSLKSSQIAQCTMKSYRFQTNQEIQDFFESLINCNNLYRTFYKNYKNGSIIEGIYSLQHLLYEKLSLNTQGLRFLIGNPHCSSPMKRWNMFLRWMVREDCLDLGLWGDIKKSDLILPLDTHTFRVSQRLGILKRKTYDLQAALEVSNFLKTLDKHDPIKYDFALYRIGQLKLINS
ncbi:TIGR02757 family protein [Helicobacter mesocricetorum]|uniref:TIGR02757 family protein n=1 Tax=Helicobacter mesocricetorum TaxID=87012 RepID=UPI000CF0C7AD|nr:TIGR02757 family protein [Helicobacter mesocricetorum]